MVSVYLVDLVAWYAVLTDLIYSSCYHAFVADDDHTCCLYFCAWSEVDCGSAGGSNNGHAAGFNAAGNAAIASVSACTGALLGGHGDAA